MREVLVLQFEGPSKQGFLSFKQLHDTQEEMIKQGAGTFQGGKFVPAREGQESIVAFEALWQFRNGRKIQYPVGRYRHPLLITPEAFDWQTFDLEGDGKAETRPVGVFSDGCVAANLIKLDSGSVKVTRKEAIQLLFFSKGSGRVSGQECYEQSVLQLDAGEEAMLDAGVDGAELIHFVLPRF